MTPDEILMSLHRKRVELEGEAIRRYEMGFGYPYTDELRKIDEQIFLIQQQVRPSVFSISNKDDFQDKISETKQIGNLSTADRKKLCVLEKLKEEENLTPKIPVSRHISFGYSYVRPANEARLSGQKLTEWIVECGLRDISDLENILSIFQQDSLISKFNFSEQDGVLKIQFPEDFEKRYNECNVEILGVQKSAKIGTQQQKMGRDKLVFYPETGDIVYKNENGVTTNGNKDYAILHLLHNNKNTAFNIADIQEHCNLLVRKDTHKFRGEKDIDDTIRQIRFKLNVKKGAFFPIIKRREKENKKWLWLEK